MPQQLIPHLFRTEFSKIVAVLCKTYGLSNIQLAEDLVSEAFLAASETWALNGVPSNPTAWLYRVAKNKAIDGFKRDRIFKEKVKPNLEENLNQYENQEIDLSEHNIQDSQLRMFFAVCNPILKPNAQAALALRILCGFNAQEISNAFLSNKETINKRIHRAKTSFKKGEIKLELPPNQLLKERLENVLSILYLLFNEGYYSSSTDKNLRKELCMEAMRLNLLLLNSTQTNSPNSNAMMALFCFHASRFDARIRETGETVLYMDQDRSLWNTELIQQGEYFLSQSSIGSKVSKYHLEAIIAFWHTRTTDSNEKWEKVLQCYNQLLQLEYSPIVALNRTFALAKVKGNKIAIEEAKKIQLKNHPHYHLLLAELYAPQQKQEAKKQLQLALELVQTESERELILKKLEAIRKSFKIKK